MAEKSTTVPVLFGHGVYCPLNRKTLGTLADWHSPPRTVRILPGEVIGHGTLDLPA